MALIFRAPEENKLVTIDYNSIKNKKKIFLAGSIDMGKAVHWQKQVEEALTDIDVAVFNPRREDFDANAKYSEDNPYMVEQIEWELKHIDMSDLVVFYFDPNGQAPITMFEMGLVAHRVYTQKKKSIVLCPEGFWKRPNVIISAQYYDFSIVNNYDEFIIRIKRALSV